MKRKTSKRNPSSSVGLVQARKVNLQRGSASRWRVFRRVCLLKGSRLTRIAKSLKWTLGKTDFYLSELVNDGLVYYKERMDGSRKFKVYYPVSSYKIILRNQPK